METTEQDHEAPPVAEPRVVHESGLARRLADLVEAVIEDVGYRLVWVRITGGDNCIVQIMAEKPDGTLGIDDCVVLTRVLSPLLDVEDPVPGGYTLEVSSPGIDRYLVRGSDFDRHAGAAVKIELRETLGGQKRFRGILEGIEDDEVRLVIEHGDLDGQQTIGLALAGVGEARLVAPAVQSQPSSTPSKGRKPENKVQARR
ncbi:MAG: ribosome maturation factor RimP [Hyphomicrobiales bacterium]